MQPPQPAAPGQKTMVPNQRSIDRQNAEADPAQVDVTTNGFGNPQNPLVTYGETFGDGLKGLSGGNGSNGNGRKR